MVVAQSEIPTPTLAPVTTPETPSLSTPNENDTNESDYESIVVVEPHVAGIPIGSVATAPPAVSSEPKVGLEFAMPKAPPPPSRPNKVSKDGRRSRQRSRSSSYRRADSRHRDEVRASIPKGVNTSEAPPNLKRARGRGRGKIAEAKTPLMAPTSSLNGTTKPREALRITIPAGTNARMVEVITAYPANVGHLAKLEGDASSHWELTEPVTVEPDFVVELPPRGPSRGFQYRPSDR